MTAIGDVSPVPQAEAYARATGDVEVPATPEGVSEEAQRQAPYRNPDVLQQLAEEYDNVDDAASDLDTHPCTLRRWARAYQVRGLLSTEVYLQAIGSDTTAARGGGA